jgi:hypothetical protein
MGKENDTMRNLITMCIGGTIGTIAACSLIEKLAMIQDALGSVFGC